MKNRTYLHTFLATLYFIGALTATVIPDANGQVIVKLNANQPEKLEVSLEDEIITSGNTSLIISDQLSVTGGTSPLTYAWMQGNTVLSTNPVFEVESGLTKKYSLVVTDSRGCKSINPFIVGIDDLLPESVNIYPVPAKSYITVDPGVNAGKIKLALINYRGDKLWDGEINGKYDLPLNYPPGIYFIEIVTDGKKTVKKILIMSN